MFKIYKGLLPTPFSWFFKITTNSTTRGHSAKITKAHCELDIRRFFFLFRKSYQQTGPRSCWIRHCKFFQEQPRANQEIKDGLLHGLSGPLSLMATSDCFNQVRPHMVSYLVSLALNTSSRQQVMRGRLYNQTISRLMSTRLSERERERERE